MDGYDGVNIEEGINGIKKYNEEIVEIRDEYIKNFNTFNEKISQVWASDNAVKYDEDLKKMLEFPEKLISGTNATNAMLGLIYYAWAGTHDLEFSIDSIEEIPEVTYSFIHMSSSIESEEFGILKGIDPDEAKEICEEFTSACKKNIYPKLSSIKLESGIIDSENVIPDAIDKGIAERAKKFLENLDTITTTFDEKIKNEAVELRLSVKESEEAIMDIPGNEASLDESLIETTVAEVETPEVTVADSVTLETPVESDSTPKVTPTPVVKPSSERPNFDRISFF